MHARFALRMTSLFIIALSFGPSIATASIIHNEAVNGDLSTDRFNPTHFTLAQGTSSIIATSSGTDREYVNMTIPAGLKLSALNHISWVGNDTTGFIAVQTGTTFTEPPTGTNVANLMGYTHFGTGPGTVGLNLLPLMALGEGAQGFTPPLNNGDYTFWIQQTGAQSVTYQFDFVVTPEPASLALLGFGALMICRNKRRK